MKAGQGVRIAVWAPIAVALGALAGVVINANVGWPIRENMTVIAAGAVAFGGWYGIFSVGLWGVGLLRGDPLARGGIATGLTLGLAAVTSLLMVPPLSLRMALFDYPAVKVAMACDVSFRADPFEEWRCDARKWPQWTEGRSVGWAGFFDDGRVAVGMGVSGPQRRKDDAHFYRTLVLLRPDGGMDESFSERFHGCLGSGETQHHRRFLPVGTRILFAEGEGTPEHFTIREVIDEDGSASGPKAAREYGQMIEDFGAEQLGVVYDEKGKALLLALGGGRAGLFDPEGRLARLMRSYPGVAATKSGLQEHLPFVVRGEELLAPPECCDATEPGLCVLRGEGRFLQTLRSAVMPEGTQFAGSPVARVEPVAVLPGAVAVYLDTKDTDGVYAQTLMLLGDDGLLRHDLDVSCGTYVDRQGRRPLRDGRIAIFSHHGAVLTPTKGGGAFLGSGEFAPTEPDAGTGDAPHLVRWHDDGEVMAVSAEGEVLMGPFGRSLHLHSRGQTRCTLALP